MARRRLTLPADPEDFGGSLPGGWLASIQCAALGLAAIAAAFVVAAQNPPFAVALLVEGGLLLAPWAERTARRLRDRHEHESLSGAPMVEGVVLGEPEEPVLVANDQTLVLRPLRVRLDDGRVVTLAGEVLVDHGESTVLQPGHRVRVQTQGLDIPSYREAPATTVAGPVLLTMDLHQAPE